jgi:hypothetical protein
LVGVAHPFKRFLTRFTRQLTNTWHVSVDLLTEVGTFLVAKVPLLFSVCLLVLVRESETTGIALQDKRAELM